MPVPASVVALLLRLALSLPAAQGDPTLCARLQAIIDDPTVARSHWGVVVETLDGSIICGIHPQQLFHPASNAKLFTAGAALALLTPAAVTETLVTAGSSPARDGTLTGDLILTGAGDSSLSSRPFPYVPDTAAAHLRKHPLDTLAAELQANGLRHVTGDILGDDTAFAREPYGAEWSLDDMLYGYGAPISALSVDDNQVTLTLSPGKTPGAAADAALLTDVPYYTLANEVKTSAAKQPTRIAFERQPGTRILRLYGNIAINDTYTQDLAIDDPALFAAMRFKRSLEAAGIAIDGQARAVHRPAGEAAGTLEQIKQPLPKLPTVPTAPAQPICLRPCPATLATYTSPPLARQVAVALKVSQNLHAELLLRRLGKAYGSDGSSAQGARVARQFWLNAGLDSSEFLLLDGSGLGNHDLATPHALAQLLVYAARQPWFLDFETALPIGGVDGTLSHRFTSTLKGKVFAKTGTTSESRALSGYLVAASGQTIVFSILNDDHLPNTTADRVQMDRIVEAIAAAN